VPLEHFRFHARANETVLHPLVLVAMLVAIIMTPWLPRSVIVPLLFSPFLIPAAEEILVAGLHVYVFRIIILLGWIRLVSIKLSPQTSLG